MLGATKKKLKALGNGAEKVEVLIDCSKRTTETPLEYIRMLNPDLSC